MSTVTSESSRSNGELASLPNCHPTPLLSGLRTVAPHAASACAQHGSACGAFRLRRFPKRLGRCQKLYILETKSVVLTNHMSRAVDARHVVLLYYGSTVRIISYKSCTTAEIRAHVLTESECLEARKAWTTLARDGGGLAFVRRKHFCIT